MLEYHHGGMIYDKDIEIDFSVNLNPLGMPSAVKQSIIDNIGTFSAYPDTESTRLRRRLAEVENIPFDRIVCGNGADDLIFRISHVLNPKRVLILSPTFSEYERSLDCSIEYYPLQSTRNFQILPDILDYLNDVDAFYLCNPNNPTGAVINPCLMNQVVNRCVQNNITLVVDECFLDFVVGGISFKSYFNNDDLNMIILKAFTKIYSMAGIRLGYALVDKVERCRDIDNSGQAWSVSSVAQVCGITALDDSTYIQRTKLYVSKEREYLMNSLKSLGFKVYSSVANYILLQSSINLYDKLLEHKILIRDCSNYRSLDESYYRIAVKTHEQNETLINILRLITNPKCDIC